MTIHAPDYVRAIAPYQAGKPIAELARELGLEEAGIVKLASNENPLGMPASARAAMTAAIDDLARYPDSNGFELKAAIARHYKVEPAGITLGNGSNDLLELAVRALVAAGDHVVYSQHAFVVYMLATQAVGARASVVPARRLGHDLDAMLAAITPQTRMVFVANPNNPTGTLIDGPRLERFIAEVPPQVAIVLDQAYDEYLTPEQRYDAVPWLARRDNLIICRTFSKAYGLAGLRLGFALAGAEVTDLMNRVRQPFNTNSLAQAAAIAALDDVAFLRRSYELNLAGREALQAAFGQMRLDYVPSAGNFVLVNVGDGAAVSDALLHQGVIVRPVGGYGLPEWIRVSVGLPGENERFLAALAQVMGRTPVAAQ